MAFTTEIDGLGPVQFTGSDYTNPALLQAFLTSLSQFYDAKTRTTALTTADLENIKTQIGFLKEIAENGVSISTAGTTPLGANTNQTYYLTTPMVEVLNNLFSSIAPSGNITNITLAELNAWRTKTTVQNAADIQNIFVFAARLFAILPLATGATAPSAISTDPVQAALQIARIFSASTFAASAVNASNAQGIQAFTEIKYVETANQVIEEKLANLKQALQTTQDTLNNLNQLQQLHNLITVNSRTFTYDLLPSMASPDVTSNEYIAQYESYASSQLKAALVPQLTTEFLPFSLPPSAYTLEISRVNVSGIDGALGGRYRFGINIHDPSKYYAFNTSTNTFTTVQSFYFMDGYYVSNAEALLSGFQDPFDFSLSKIQQIVGDGYNGVQKFPLLGTISGITKLQTQLVAQLEQLSGLLVSLSAVTPTSALSGIKRSQALLGQVSTVYTDLKNNIGGYTASTAPLTAAVGVRQWIMDNYQSFSSSSATNAGLLQQHITNAITAAQSANSTQTQNVNNTLLIFQQYYQSAAAVLTQLNQIIVKMAQKITT